MKTVVVIGSGNVAEALAGAIAASPYGLAQLYARNRDRGERIARSYGCPFASDPPRVGSGRHLSDRRKRPGGRRSGRSARFRPSPSWPIRPAAYRSTGCREKSGTGACSILCKLSRPGGISLSATCRCSSKAPIRRRPVPCFVWHARLARTRGKPRRRNGRSCIWQPSSQAIFRTTCTRSPSSCSTGTDFRPIC